jgi:tRNA(Ile)-lysidine synthase
MSRSEFSQVEKEFTRALSELPGDVLKSGFLAGISGGVDSMVMLHLFHLLGLNVTVAHVNYRQRGEASELDEKLVVAAANGYGYACRVLKPDMEELARGNFQDKARKVRYRFFAETMQQSGHDCIALAHQQDDQIETILMKLFRGAGVGSWSGMSVWQNGLFRPLLNVPRHLVEHYAGKNKIEYRQDKSNLGQKYARNYIRLHLLPELDGKIPGIRQNILNLPKIALSASQATAWIAGRITDDEACIDAASLLEMETGLRSAVILHLVKKNFGGLSVSSGGLSRLSELGNLQTGKFMELSSGIRLYRENDVFRLYAGTLPDEPDPEIPCTIEMADLQAGDLIRSGFIFSLENRPQPFDRDSLQLDASRLNDRLTLRRWKPGDRFIPFGMSGTQLVSDHLTNRKITGPEKNDTLVLTIFEGSICAVIFPHPKKREHTGTIDNRYALDGHSNRILRIRSQ